MVAPKKLWQTLKNFDYPIKDAIFAEYEKLLDEQEELVTEE